MIEITPKDLAVRNARGGESYILLCTLRNETELVLDCNIQTSQASSERWEVTPRAFRMKPRQKQSVELKLSMPQCELRSELAKARHRCKAYFGGARRLQPWGRARLAVS